MTWKRKERTWYLCGHILSTSLTSLFLRPKVVGKKNLPRSGSVLITPNHRSMLDIPVLGCATFRPMRFMAKKTLFKSAFIRWYFETNGSFSVDKDDNDPKAVKRAISVLKDGDALVVFPEGKRSQEDEIIELASGAAFLAVKSACPVLPVGIAGLDKVFSFRRGIPRLSRAYVVVGEPITSHIGVEGKTSEATRDLLAVMHTRISEVYAQARDLSEKGLGGGK